jgi:hypothetical protein
MPPERRGALVISLDFELAWGVRDVFDLDGPYRANLLGAREAVPRILDRFTSHEVAATWATVGFLMADGRDEALAFAPIERPAYADRHLDPYPTLDGRHPHERAGDSERSDPVRFAPSLVRAIAAAPRQELASHTYAHFTALEPGATREAFAADLHAAQAIATARFGTRVRSLVLPRHQVRRDWLPSVAAAGFRAHRGPEPHVLGVPHAGVHDAAWKRAARLADAFVPLTGANAAAWPRIDPHGLVDVPESRFLRPASRRLAPLLEPLRVHRIVLAMESAARAGRICHVWWHPHNFGADLNANLRNLDAILGRFDRLRDALGFESLTMADVADRVVVAHPPEAGADARADQPRDVGTATAASSSR